MDKKASYIDEVEIKNKKILMRVDFNVSLSVDKLSIADDARIKQAVPTILYLLNNQNKLILVSHLDRPKGRDPKLSLKIVTDHLHSLIPQYDVILINDFLKQEDKERIKNQKKNEIIMLENIRYYPEEKANDKKFSKELSFLAEIFVNDAFGVCHRADASVVGVAKFLPSYGGLLLKKEIIMISKAIKNPKKPVVAILGGAKISTKINLLGKLMEIADYLLIGGGMANIFFCAQGKNIGQSLCEYNEVENARKLLFMAAQKNTTIVLPTDVIQSYSKDNTTSSEVRDIDHIDEKGCILDIGPETQARFGAIINNAKTILWNGPVGYTENPAFRRGTDFIYYAIAHNPNAVSIVGGGDTLAAISKKEYLDKITHISTGGGAMLEFIEKGTLPGIEALKK
ncbi:MAG: phosphoglycerate kinase [bacterium]|nr:phosphoglycerate kinase [bacterium]